MVVCSAAYGAIASLRYCRSQAVACQCLYALQLPNTMRRAGALRRACARLVAGDVLLWCERPSVASAGTEMRVSVLQIAAATGQFMLSNDVLYFHISKDAVRTLRLPTLPHCVTIILSRALCEYVRPC